MAVQIDALNQKSLEITETTEVSETSFEKTLKPGEFYGFNNLDLDVSFGDDYESLRTSTDLTDRSVMTLQNEY